MEIRMESKSGAVVGALPQVVDSISQQVGKRPQEWLDELSGDPGKFSKVERAVHETFRQWADQMVAGLLAVASRASPALEAAKQEIVQQAAAPLRAGERRTTMLRLLGGLVVWVTTLYCGPAARTGCKRGRHGAGLYPELAAYEIRGGVTPELASELARWSVLLSSYEATRRELERRGLRLDVKVVHRIARQVGAEVLGARTEMLQQYRLGKLAVGIVLAGKRVGVAFDGGRVKTRKGVRKVRDKQTGKKRRVPYRTEWREPKLVIIFQLDERGRMKRGTEPWIDGTFGGPDAIMELAAMHLHRLGAVQATEVVFLGDGAPWIWERVEWVWRRVGLEAWRVVCVLDWCHAMHQVSLALQQLGLKESERHRRYRELRQWLRTSQWRRVVDQLAQWGKGLAKKSDYWTKLSYLENHGLAGRLAYLKFRRRGIPIGSGAIESAIRRVVNLRLKGNGITWLAGNAEAALVLRAAELTGRWDETLTHARRVLASRRRLDWSWKSPNLRKTLKSPESIRPPSAQLQATSAPIRAAA